MNQTKNESMSALCHVYIGNTSKVDTEEELLEEGLFSMSGCCAKLHAPCMMGVVNYHSDFNN